MDTPRRRSNRMPERAVLTQQHAEESFRLLVEGVTDYAIYMLDRGGHVLTWNAGAERINGYRADEIVGQHFSRFYPSEDRRERKPERQLLLAETEGRVMDEGWRLRKDGTRFWANAVITPLRDMHGTLVAFAKVTRDLTQQRRAQEAVRRAEERFHLLVDGVRDYAIFLLSRDGRIETWNLGAERIKGYRAEEILGHHFSQFYTPEDVADDKPERLLAAAVRDGRVEDEGWRVRKDGARFWANVIITALRDPDGGLTGFAKITRDLSERRRVEEALARSHAELESFSYSVSHDLRAPLRAIDGYAKALLEDHGPSLDADGQRMLGIVRDNARHMGQLIDSLLAFSRLGRQPLRKAAINMQGVAEGVVEELRRGGGSNFPEVSVQPLPAAVGDPTLIRQVLANLIGNAFKFSAARPNPRVEIGVRVDGGENVYYVKDNGVGFDMRYADKLFKVFSRLHRMEDFEGTGVGLALVHRIIHRHGGRIWAESAVDHGATFFFTVPYAEDAP
jgi:PAS domain S-box-containing protein